MRCPCSGQCGAHALGSAVRMRCACGAYAAVGMRCCACRCRCTACLHAEDVLAVWVGRGALAVGATDGPAHLAASRVAVDDAPLQLLADALAAVLAPAHLAAHEGAEGSRTRAAASRAWGCRHGAPHRATKGRPKRSSCRGWRGGTTSGQRRSRGLAPMGGGGVVEWRDGHGCGAGAGGKRGGWGGVVGVGCGGCGGMWWVWWVSGVWVWWGCGGCCYVELQSIHRLESRLLLLGGGRRRGVGARRAVACERALLLVHAHLHTRPG